MRSLLIAISALLLTACAAGEGGGASADAAPVPADPGGSTDACAGSPVVASYSTAIPTTHQIAVAASCKITTSWQCGSMDWQISGITDHTFSTSQTITLTQVGSYSAFGAYCLRPENSPYTCTALRYWDPGLGKYTLSLSCDHSYSKAWLAN